MKESESCPIRVLLVEASVLTLTLLKRALAPAANIQVVGSTQAPKEALALVAERDPHVICVGLHLPETDSHIFVQAVMERFPRPVLVVGSALREGDPAIVFRMFEAGALDFFLEPLTWRDEEGGHFSRELIGKVRLLASLDTLSTSVVQERSHDNSSTLPQHALPGVHMLVLGVGIGGLNALRETLAGLPIHFSAAILCVVHLHPELQPFLVDWLAEMTPMLVQEATHGEVPMPGSVYLPPEGQHLLVDSHGRLALSTPQAGFVGGKLPSITVTMESVAGHFATLVIGALLSGTGEDGARGLEAIAVSGGYTLALDESSAMAFDLPARLLEMGTVRHLLPCSVMARALLILTGQDATYSPCPHPKWPSKEGISSQSQAGAADNKEEKQTGHLLTQAFLAGEGILIVEDSPIQAFKLRRFLQESGFSVAVARDGIEGLELTKSLSPRLVLSDVSMPRMDGFQLCHAIKTDASLKTTPVILLTALTNPEEILEGLSVGADNYLTKPWEASYLLERIQSILATSQEEYKTEDALEIPFGDKTYTITSTRRQVLDLLMETYQRAVKQNKALMNSHLELKMLNSRIIDQAARLEITNQSLHSEIFERRKVEAEQKNTLQALESANQELNNFAYIVAHDLKAPFRAVGSLTSWLLSDFSDKLGADGQDLVQLLHGRADRLNRLIDALLQYVRVTRVDETLLDLDLNRLVHDVIKALNPPEEMEVVLETQLPVIHFDPKRAKQLFHALISNAVNFMDKPLGIVRVALDSGEGAFWQFSVADNGPGIEKQHFEKIFVIFQTLQARDNVETTGMGLALVRKIVEKFGGRIWLTSQVGEGSTFYFTLPKELGGI